MMIQDQQPNLNPQTHEVAERSLEEQARIDGILASAQERHILRRTLHQVTGHPKEQVYYGDVHEGATCGCGEHWTVADMQV